MVSRRPPPPPWMIDSRDWPVRRQLALLRIRMALERLKMKESRNG